MNKNEIFAYIFHFLSIVFEKLKNNINKVSKIILFGSVARGDFDERSDIDIFIDVPNKKNIKIVNRILEESLNEFEDIAKETWYLRKVDFPIKYMVDKLDNKRWENLRKELNAYGIILYSSYEESPRDVKNYSLFEYSLAKFNKKQKMKIIRNLLGYKIKKEKKTYEIKGFLNEINGIKLMQNVVLVPINKSFELHNFFTRNKVTPKIKEVWFQSM